MVGDRQVLVAPGRRRRQHRLQRLPAVTRQVGVHVQVAAQVALLDRPGQGPRAGQLDLAVVLPQLGRDPGQAEGGVHLLLRGGGDDPAGGRLGQAVLAERPPSVDGQLAQADVVRLRPGEVQRRRPVLPGLHHPQVDLHARRGHDRRLAGAVGDHLGDDRHRGEAAPSPPPGLPSAATTTSMSPMVSRNRRRLPMTSARTTPGTAPRAAVTSAAGRRASPMGVRRSLPPMPEPLDGAGDVLLALRPQAGHGAQGLGVDGRLEILDRRHPQVLPQGERRLRARPPAPGSAPGKPAGTRRAGGRAWRCAPSPPAPGSCGRCSAPPPAGRRASASLSAATGRGCPSTVRAARS